MLKSNTIKAMAVVLMALSTTAASPKPVMSPAQITEHIQQDPPKHLNYYDKRQIQCMADNIYHEAGNQSEQGMIAVSNVVMNRVKDSRFPKSPCGVIHQKRGGVCQFSWVCQAKARIRNGHITEKAKKIAELVYLQNIGDVTRNALFYHANYVRPGWSRQFRRTIVIGDHIFYRG